MNKIFSVRAGLIKPNKKLTVLCPQRRALNLHEYQSKKLMADNDIAVQRFRVASTSTDCEKIANSFKVDEYVIKAQIMAGGRGKGTFDTGYKGGVKLTKDPAQITGLVSKMLGNRLVTKQTSADGVRVEKVMVAEAFDIVQETYLAILMDRSSDGPVLVGSPRGGMDIEKVAEETPELLYKIPIDIVAGITDKQAMEMARNLKFEGKFQKVAAMEIKNLYALFLKVDATQIEINPFAQTPEGQVICFDAKMNFDDNAKFRQKAIFDMEDTAELDPREVDAARHDLNYIGLNGNIGCMVNGAGLAMATMDLIKMCGGTPANFLDVGGSATEAQVENAFRIISSDTAVKCIFVNIFGGIMNCATVANGIIKAVQRLGLSLPLVVRLEGTNVDQAKRLLAESKLPILTADDFSTAAEMAVRQLN